MQAATGAASVGAIKCSDGQVLIEPMELANELTDTLASAVLKLLGDQRE